MHTPLTTKEKKQKKKQKNRHVLMNTSQQMLAVCKEGQLLYVFSV